MNGERAMNKFLVLASQDVNCTNNGAVENMNPPRKAMKSSLLNSRMRIYMEKAPKIPIITPRIQTLASMSTPVETETSANSTGDAAGYEKGYSPKYEYGCRIHLSWA